MTDIRGRLRDADPLLHEPALPPDVVAAMRRRVLNAAQESARPIARWNRTLAMAAVIALIAGAGVDIARRAPRSAQSAAPIPAAPGVPGTAKTQLQFSTPGGTRIIWTLDPTFHLTETR